MARICLYDVLGTLVNDKFFIKKYSIIKDFLSCRYHYILNLPEEATYHSNTATQNVIWVFWWQGEEKLPPICRACIDSLYKYNSEYEITFLSESNFSEYVDVPQTIIDKVRNGVFSVTHLSDIIRLMLLAKYGGLWVDATLYFTQKIPSSWFDYPFFSIKNESDSNIYISKSQWSTFIMGGDKSSSFFKVLSKLMVAYGEREDCFIEYMTMDVFMRLLFERPNYSPLLDNLPVMNEGLHKLRPLLNSIFDSSEFNMLSMHNVCFKLTYKMKFSANPNTYYNFLLNNDI